MSNMFIRTISGVLYVALVMLTTFSGEFGQVFLAAFLVIAAMIEWMQFDKEAKDISFPTALSIGSIFLSIYCFTGIFDVDVVQLRWLKALLIVMLTTLMMNLAFNSRDVPKKLFHTIFGLMYIGFPLIVLPMLPQYMGENQPWMLGSVFILIWCNDTFAYLFGRSFGKHKLYERISPNKTWEGFIGGAISALVASAVMSHYLTFMPIIGWVGLAIIVLIFGTVGDLFESALKRSFGRKDSGKFMPGHGGILDRIDSLLFTLPLSYFYIRIIENLAQ